MSSDRFESLAELFSKLKFRRQVIGGLSEADVWKKLEAVQTEYRRLYDLQAAGYEARLKEREDRIRQLEEELAVAGGEHLLEQRILKTGGSCQMEQMFSAADGNHKPEKQLSGNGEGRKKL